MVTALPATEPVTREQRLVAILRYWKDDPVLRRILLWKLGFFAFVLGALWLRPGMDIGGFTSNLPWPRTGNPVFASHFAAWDSAHYLLLSEVGYQAGTSSCAFYPLFPWFIRLGSHLTGSSHLIAGLLLANVSSLIGLRLFYALVRDRIGETVARSALWVFLLMPGAFFLHLIYSESLFFCLLMVFCTALQRGRWFWLALAGFLLPLTRPVGVFCVVPLAWHLWTGGHRSRWCWLLAPLAGWGAYFAAMGAMTGNAWEGFAAQRNHWPTNSAAHLLDPVGTLGAYLNVQGFHQSYGSLLDRIAFAAFLAELSFWWRRDKEWWLWAVVLGVLPGILAWFAAYLRYAAMAFPAAVALAVWSQDKKARDGILCGLAGLQTGLVWRHIHFVWAG